MTDRDTQTRPDAAGGGGFVRQLGLRIAVFAALLGVLHIAGAGARRESLITGIQATDVLATMQGRMTREAVYRTASSVPGIDSDTRAADLGAATRLGQDNPSGSGLAQMAARGAGLRHESAAWDGAAEGFDLGESALQLAIMLLAVALVIGESGISGACARMTKAASYLAGAGVALALLTALVAALA